MSSGCVIIRLQNLPLEARSIDIRRFFDGLQIPDGGVHIIGGERGDAFIAFNSDDDARMAMARDGLPLCSSRVRLYLSSKNEMNAVIAAARGGQPIPSAVPPPSLPQQQQQPVNTNSNILDSITKLISGNKLPQAAPQATPQPQVATDPLKTLTSLLPQLKPASVPAAAQPAYSASSYQTASSVANSVAGNNAAKPNINIDQILDLLKNHLNKPPAAPNQPSSNVNNPAYYSAIQPVNSAAAYTAYNSSSNNSAAYNYYNAAANSSTYPPITSTGFNASSGQPKKKTLLGTPPDPSIDSNGSKSNGAGSKKTLIQTKPPTSSYTTSSSRRDDYDNGDNKDWSSIQLKSSDKIIKLKNFKTTSTPKDIRNFLQGISIEHDGIKLLQDYQTGAKNGQALVRLVSTADTKKALSRNGQSYDDQCIQVFESSVADFNRVSSLLLHAEAKLKASTGNSNKRVLLPTPPNSNNNNGYSVGSPNSDTNGSVETRHHISIPDGFYLKVYGLPPELNDDEVRDLFGDVRIMRMFTAHTPFGGGGGNVVVKAKKLLQVETKQDVDRALKRNDERFGKSKLHIYQINKYDFEKELNREEFREMKRKRQQQLKEQLSMASDEVNRMLSESDGRKEDWNDEDPDSRNRKKLRLDDEEDQYSRNSDNSRTRDSSEEKELDSYDPRSNGKRKKSLLPLPANEGKRAGRPGGLLSPPPSSLPSQTPLVIDLPPLPPELQQYSSQMVLLSNVNHEATREDILELFREFEPIEETLKIRHDDQGLPTGDAIVAASSQLKAIESVQQLNGSRFMGQRIRVLLINPV